MDANHILEKNVNISTMPCSTPIQRKWCQKLSSSFDLGHFGVHQGFVHVHYSWTHVDAILLHNGTSALPVVGLPSVPDPPSILDTQEICPEGWHRSARSSRTRSDSIKTYCLDRSGSSDHNTAGI
ncbi:hypothetical protein AVEN_239239-1 [Araneus ventricosus]|uniref:Uncharacterized protein n=1 Tax=Araneus ventricosus TaxID=182803 RepID=A0A4Y2J7V4_ARAVE|nr:hypothetical protein AVEN_239239-1 [Araneus ventricosus]